MVKRDDSLVASVSILRDGRGQGTRSTPKKSKDRDWQAEAWRFYHEVGEVRFAARYIGNSLARVRFFVGKRERPGAPIEPIDDTAAGDDAIARDCIDRLKGRDGTFQSLVRDYGTQQFIAGESWLVGVDRDKPDEKWEFISTTEHRRLEANVATKAVTKQPGDDSAEEPADAIVARFWQRDPEDRSRADSSLRPVLDICDALQTAQQMQVAADRSRIASAGIVFIPAEASLPKTPVTESDGPNARPHLTLLDEMLDVMAQAMDDPGSAAAVVPILVEMKGDLIQKIDHLRFDREVDKTIAERIDHHIRRLAQGLDLVPEKLLGVGDTNHWTAWNIDENTVMAHVVPLAVSFAEDMSVGFLRPTLAAAGEFHGDPAEYAVWYDVTDLVVSPNRTEDAKWAYEHLVIDTVTMSEVLGFTPDNAPLPDEINRVLAIRQANASTVLTGPVLDSRGKPIAPPKPVAPVVQPPAPPADGVPGPDGEQPVGDKKGPPATKPTGPPDEAQGAPPARKPRARGKAASDPEILAARIVGACDTEIEILAERAAVAALMSVDAGDATSAMDGAFDRLARRLMDWEIPDSVVTRLIAGVSTLAQRRMVDDTFDPTDLLAVLADAAVSVGSTEAA